MCVCVDWGVKLEDPERTHADTWTTSKLYTEKPPDPPWGRNWTRMSVTSYDSFLNFQRCACQAAAFIWHKAPSVPCSIMFSSWTMDSSWLPFKPNFTRLDDEHHRKLQPTPSVDYVARWKELQFYHLRASTPDFYFKPLSGVRSPILPGASSDAATRMNNSWENMFRRHNSGN